MKKIDWLVIAVICAVSLFTLKDLFKPGMYTSHDGIHQIVRLFYFDQAIADGQIPPRWAGGLMNGFGYPLFIFSYHLPWVIGEIFHLFGSSIIDSVKYTFLVGFALSGITMYLFQKDIYGRLAAIAGTGIYLFSPFRFSNIFVRAAIGDATSYIFAPFVFWSVYRLRKGRDWKFIVLGAIGFAGLILSHAMVAALFISAVLLYFLLLLFFTKERRVFIKSFLTTGILGAGISAYYLVPSILEKNNTVFQNLMGQIFTGSYFPTVNDLIYSKWGYGVFHAQEGAMSVQLGLVQWLIIFLTLVAVIFIPKIVKKVSKDEKQLLLHTKILLTVFAVTIFMMLPVSLPIWKLINPLVLVDFPWRYLTVSVFFVSLCTGFLVAVVPRFKWLLAAFLILSAVYFNRNNLRVNEMLPWDLPFMLKLERTTNSYDEYTPKWVRNDLISENKPKVEFPEGNAGIEIMENKSNLLEFSINPLESGTVRVNTIYYPGWRVWVDGKEERIDYSNGLIEFKVGEGKKTVVARFTETPLRMVSNIITLVTLVLLFLPQFLPKKK